MPKTRSRRDASDEDEDYEQPDKEVADQEVADQQEAEDRRRCLPPPPPPRDPLDPQELSAMILQLMQVIQASQASTTRDQQAVSTAMVERSEAARAVARTNGIYGYASDRALTQEEGAFREMLLDLGTGMNIETSEELFRQGISSTLKLIRLSKDRLKSIVLNMAKNKSPMCPYPVRV